MAVCVIFIEGCSVSLYDWGSAETGDDDRCKRLARDRLRSLSLRDQYELLRFFDKARCRLHRQFRGEAIVGYRGLAACRVFALHL